MKKEQKTMMVVAMVAVFIAAGIFFADLAVAGSLEPTGPPAPTMIPLDELPTTWSRILPANDGEADGCNSSRFKCVMGGAAVLDGETGLTWARNANLYGGTTSWDNAIQYCVNFTLGNRKGWKLPTREQLASLLDFSISGSPKLPSGHPFTNVQTYYWSSNESETDMGDAWYVDFSTGGLVAWGKGTSGEISVWPVRGGN